jgi:hypothetical protein
VVGYLGIGLGVLIVGLGAATLLQAAPDDAGGPLFLVVIGIAVSVVSYLGARR